MSESLSQIQALLLDRILPHLKAVQDHQAQQSLQSDQLSREIQEFRAEMLLRFAELRAEIAYCRQEVEDAMTVLVEQESAGESRRILNKAHIH